MENRWGGIDGLNKSLSKNPARRRLSRSVFRQKLSVYKFKNLKTLLFLFINLCDKINNMTYHIITYGCQMNKSDSERIAHILEKMGYKPEDDKNQADLIVINMCSVRQSAVDRAYGKIRDFAKLKTQN